MAGFGISGIEPRHTDLIENVMIFSLKSLLKTKKLISILATLSCVVVLEPSRRGLNLDLSYARKI